MRTKQLLSLVLFFVGGPILHAQVKLAIYGTFGAEDSGFQNRTWTPAGTFGLYYVLRDHEWADVSIDARGDISSDLRSGLFGPRIALRLPHNPLKPYGEFLLGGISFSSRNDGVFDASDLAYRFVGGLDIAMLPHLDLRAVDFEYGGGLDYIEKTIHQTTISSGVVVRF